MVQVQGLGVVTFTHIAMRVIENFTGTLHICSVRWHTDKIKKSSNAITGIIEGILVFKHTLG